MCISYFHQWVLKPSINSKNWTTWPESARELYHLSDRLFSVKLVPTFANRGCHVVSVTDPYGCTIGFLDRNRYFIFQAAPQLYSRGLVDPITDPPRLRKSGNSGNGICSQELWPLDHRGGLKPSTAFNKYCKLPCFSLCNFLQLPATLSLTAPCSHPPSIYVITLVREIKSTAMQKTWDEISVTFWNRGTGLPFNPWGR
jgi:hypothetical protein